MVSNEFEAPLWKAEVFWLGLVPFQPTRNQNSARFQGQVNFKDFIFASEKTKNVKNIDSDIKNMAKNEIPPIRETIDQLKKQFWRDVKSVAKKLKKLKTFTKSAFTKETMKNIDSDVKNVAKKQNLPIRETID